MNSDIAMIIVTIITGLFSILSIKVQRTENNLIDKMDEQTVFIDKERSMKQKLTLAEKKRDMIIEQITIFSMKTITHLITISKIDSNIIDDIKSASLELENSYKEISMYIDTTSKEYELLTEIISSIQDDVSKLKAKKSKFSK